MINETEALKKAWFEKQNDKRNRSPEKGMV
jgi:hypothetical protein